MSMKQTLKLDITKGTTKEELAAFAAALPEGAAVTTDATYIRKDRPYESDTILVGLSAEWMV